MATGQWAENNWSGSHLGMENGISIPYRQALQKPVKNRQSETSFVEGKNFVNRTKK